MPSSGVAAIIIGKNGGSMKPAQVAAARRASADDRGKPERDDFYGHGRVNAANPRASLRAKDARRPGETRPPVGSLGHCLQR